MAPTTPKWRRFTRKTAINAIVLLSKTSLRARERATHGRLGHAMSSLPIGQRGDAANRGGGIQFLVYNRKLCYIFALVGSIEWRGSEENRTARWGRRSFLLESVVTH